MQGVDRFPVVDAALTEGEHRLGGEHLPDRAGEHARAGEVDDGRLGVGNRAIAQSVSRGNDVVERPPEERVSRCCHQAPLDELVPGHGQPVSDGCRWRFWHGVALIGQHRCVLPADDSGKGLAEPLRDVEVDPAATQQHRVAEDVGSHLREHGPAVHLGDRLTCELGGHEGVGIGMPVQVEGEVRIALLQQAQ